MGYVWSEYQGHGEADEVVDPAETRTPTMLDRWQQLRQGISAQRSDYFKAYDMRLNEALYHHWSRNVADDSSIISKEEFDSLIREMAEIPIDENCKPPNLEPTHAYLRTPPPALLRLLGGDKDGIKALVRQWNKKHGVQEPGENHGTRNFRTPLPHRGKRPQH